MSFIFRRHSKFLVMETFQQNHKLKIYSKPPKEKIGPLVGLILFVRLKWEGVSRGECVVLSLVLNCNWLNFSLFEAKMWVFRVQCFWCVTVLLVMRGTQANIAPWPAKVEKMFYSSGIRKSVWSSGPWKRIRWWNCNTAASIYASINLLICPQGHGRRAFTEHVSS